MLDEFNRDIPERELMACAAIDPASFDALISGHYAELQKRTKEQLELCIDDLAREILHDAILEVLEKPKDVDPHRSFADIVMDAVRRRINSQPIPDATVPLHAKRLKYIHAQNADPVEVISDSQSPLNRLLTADLRSVELTQKALAPTIKPFRR